MTTGKDIDRPFISLGNPPVTNVAFDLLAKHDLDNQDLTGSEEFEKSIMVFDASANLVALAIP